MRKLYYLISGFIIGIANVIPGLSGATLAVSLGIYEKIIESVTTLFSEFKKNIVFLSFLGIGMIAGILTFAKGLSFAFEEYELWTVCFFIGLILGGVPYIFNKTNKSFNFKNIFIFAIAFFLILFLGSMTVSTNGDIVNPGMLDYMIILIAGFLGASAMIIPGISGSFIFILLGVYEYIINTLNNLTIPTLFLESFIVLIFLGIGVLIGIFTVAKVMKFLIEKHQNTTYTAILGIIFASIIVLIIPQIQTEVIFGQALIAVLLIDFGFFVSLLLGGIKWLALYY